MSFINHASCNGSMPAQLVGATYFNRNTLLATMIRDRGKVRYLVAPTGFGKSLLACSYANLVNELKRTFWIEGTNPCFLRDLDAHVLASDLIECTNEGDLVVFDDVPKMARVRQDMLWEICVHLTNMAREVVLCATPVSDPLREHADSCTCFEPASFLFTDEEINDCYDISFVRLGEGWHESNVRRVPALAMLKHGCVEKFFVKHIEDLDDDNEVALTFSMLLFEQGTLDDLSSLLCRDVTPDDVSERFMRPFIDFDHAEGVFSVFGLPIEEVMRAFMPHLLRIARTTGSDDASEFISRAASMLLDSGKADRAVKVLVRASEPHTRAAWLKENQDFMLDSCMLAPAENLFASLKGERWRADPVLSKATRIRRAIMGVGDSPLPDLERIARKIDYPLSVRIESAAYAYLLSEDDQTCSDLETLFAAQRGSLAGEAKNLPAAQQPLWRFWSCDVADASSLDAVCREDFVESGNPLALACCVRKARRMDASFSELPHFCASVSASLRADRERGDNTAPLCLLRREADAFGVPLDMTDPKMMATYRILDEFEDRLTVQRSICLRSRVAVEGSLATSLLVSALGANHFSSKPRIPHLVVRLFGRCEACIDGAVVENEDFRRRKVRTLFSLLVLEKGRDLSCDTLAERLWPESAPHAARHNLYNCIGHIRKSIVLPDGTCPYITRMHGVVKLSDGLVESDVAALDDLCRRLRFEEVDPDVYLHMLEQVKDLYRGDLLPSEGNEPMVIAMREEWRSRLVNTLMYAARRLLSVGDGTAALQIAQQALRYDPAREDCYEQLIAMQARYGQRPAAIETWLRYRNYLYDELGLDPADRVSDLYERILTDEW